MLHRSRRDGAIVASDKIGLRHGLPITWYAIPGMVYQYVVWYQVYVKVVRLRSTVPFNQYAVCPWPCRSYGIAVSPRVRDRARRD